MSASDNILIVEDEPGWQNTLEVLLKGEGYGVVLTTEYSKALERILRAGAWFTMADLAVCVVDLRLAGSTVEKNWDGLGLLAVCKMRGIPAIVVSGLLTRGLENQLIDQFGVLACFHKDAFANAVQEFLTVIREALAPHRRVRGRGLLQMEGPGDVEFRTKLQTLVDTVIERYRQAHAIINDKQRERRIARGRPSAEDEALWEQQLRYLDQKYGTAIGKLNQVSTVDELDRLHPEIIRECMRWVIGSTR